MTRPHLARFRDYERITASVIVKGGTYAEAYTQVCQNAIYHDDVVLYNLKLSKDNCIHIDRKREVEGGADGC